MTLEQDYFNHEAFSAPEMSATFHLIQPVGSNFATAHITEALTWRPYARDAEAFESGYLVVFRSVLRKDADRDVVSRLDAEAEIEASKQEGFIGYFKGPLNEETLEDLSCCLWDSREDARKAASLPKHIAATRIVDTHYASYAIERFLLEKQQKPDGPWIQFEQLIF